VRVNYGRLHVAQERRQLRHARPELVPMIEIDGVMRDAGAAQPGPICRPVGVIAAADWVLLVFGRVACVVALAVGVFDTIGVVGAVGVPTAGTCAVGDGA